jgi:hypothetical protein
LEESRGTSFADGDVRACREGAVDPFQCHQIPAIIYYRNDAACMVLVRLCHGRRDCALCAIERQGLSVCNLCSRCCAGKICQRENYGANRPEFHVEFSWL